VPADPLVEAGVPEENIRRFAVDVLDILFVFLNENGVDVDF
jgi:hypothetical protein